MPDIYSFPTLLAVVGQLPPTSQFILNTFFQDGVTWDTEEVEIQTVKNSRPLAPYVSDLQTGKLVGRAGFSAKQYKPAPIKVARSITHYDLQIRAAGENLINPDAPEVRAAKLLAKDMIELNEMIVRRKIEMAVGLIFTGKVVQIGEGVEQEVNFDFTNKLTLSGNDLWSNDLANPMKTLANARLAIMQKGGATPRKLLCDYESAVTLVGHKSIVNKAGNIGLDAGPIATTLLPDGVTFHGHLRDVGLDIYSYTGTYTNDAGVDTPIMPAGTVVLLSDDKFTFNYGAHLVMTEGGEFKYAREQVLPTSWFKRQPAVRFLELASKPIPVPGNVDGWYVIKVL